MIRCPLAEYTGIVGLASLIAVCRRVSSQRMARCQALRCMAPTGEVAPGRHRSTLATVVVIFCRVKIEMHDE